MNKALACVILLLSLLAAPSAVAQSVQQSGAVTPGHAVKWVTNGIVGDAGTAQNGSLSSLGITNNGGSGICVNSAPITGPYNQTCISTTTNGGSKISSYAFGGATSPGFTFDINGSVQGFLTATLPVTNNNFACFDGTTGTVKDCGSSPTSSLTQYHFFIGNAGNVPTDSALLGDCTYGASGIACSKTNGVAFATSATTDTTNASNITSGTLSAARLPASLPAPLTSGNTAMGAGAGTDVFTIYNQRTLYVPNLSSDLSCFCNTFVGNGGQSLAHTSGLEGRYNIGIGQQSLLNITTGQYNVLTGFEAGFAITSGAYNTGFGEATLFSVTTGIDNTAIGWKGLLLATGNDNTCVGYGCMLAVTTGNNNVAIGSGTLNGASGATPANNTIVGQGAATIVTTAGHNASLGSSNLPTLTTGIYNTVVGDTSGSGITIGNYNTIIGGQLNGFAAGLSNNIVIGDGQGNARAVFNSGWTFTSAATNFKLPTTNGSATNVLITDGSGNTSWAAAGGAAITALTGDVTATGPGSAVASLANIPSAVPAAGTIIHTNIAAPASPAAGKVSVYSDSTDLRFHDKNASGVIGTTVVADTGAANNYISAISAAGVISKSRPACATLSDSSTGCATTVGTMATQNASAVAITGGTAAGLTGLAIRDTSAAFDVTLAATSSTALTAGRTITFNMQNVAHILTLGTTANTGSGIIFPNTATDTVAMLGVANNFSAAQTVSNNTASTTPATGALIVTGGLGVGGAGYFGGAALSVNFSQNAATQLSSINQNAGASASANILIGSNFGNLTVTQYSTAAGGSSNVAVPSDGSLNIDLPGATGGVFSVRTTNGFNTRLSVAANGQVTMPAAIASTSKTTGTVVITGGLGNSGAHYTDTLNVITMANTATTSAVCYNTGTGLLTYDGTIGTCTVSDERLKNMGPRIDNALNKLLQINGVNYTWKNAKYGTGPQIGVGAQTVEKVFPELVQTGSDGIKSVDYQRLTAPIIEALRELKADNDNLRAEVVKIRRAANRKR